MVNFYFVNTFLKNFFIFVKVTPICILFHSISYINLRIEVFNFYILLERKMLIMNNNIDMSKLMQMLSKMDKNQLEKGLQQVQQMLDSKDKNKNQ